MLLGHQPLNSYSSPLHSFTAQQKPSLPARSLSLLPRRLALPLHISFTALITYHSVYWSPNLFILKLSEGRLVSYSSLCYLYTAWPWTSEQGKERSLPS